MTNDIQFEEIDSNNINFNSIFEDGRWLYINKVGWFRNKQIKLKVVIYSVLILKILVKI